jgi:hypothetical protein
MHPARHTVTGAPAASAAHAARPPIHLARLLALLAATAGVLALFALGIWAFLGSVEPSSGSTPSSAQLITVSPSQHR